MRRASCVVRKTQYASRTTHNGFTLVEVMVTIAILAIGIIGILRVYSGLLNAVGASYEYMDAVCLAKERMAEVELSELQNKGIVKGTVEGESHGIYADFNWKQIVEPSDDKKLNIINVTVFKKNTASSRKFNLFSYVTNKEQ